MGHQKDVTLVIGAGMGGLAAALRLLAAGQRVCVLECHDHPGGKMRVTPSVAGPVDAGPTVLTLRAVLDDLLETTGTSPEALGLRLVPLRVLARHFWPDGTRLDLVPDMAETRNNVRAAFGPEAAREFETFAQQTRRLFAAFEAPIMQAARPSLARAGVAALRAPDLWPWLLPGRSLADMLRARLSDRRLQQLFGRYATYVGGNPLQAPPLLALIWQAEARGVWAIEGGMARLAAALADRIVALGGEIRYGARVACISGRNGAVRGVTLDSGEALVARHVVFNGDPRALSSLLDRPAAPRRKQTDPRSLSAHVWTLAATASGVLCDELAYHSVFFADDAAQEFGPLTRGDVPLDPTIYVCAQDRLRHRPAGPERLQFILNAPATALKALPCPTDPFRRLAQFGLTLVPSPDPVLTTPPDFAGLFPMSQGALYGLSPDHALATFRRPRVRSLLNGLYLAGGGVHPGAGVPMALLSGKHAAQAVMDDLTSDAMSPRTAMRGGTSTGSAIAARAPSR
jgi:1-hydroxycarotenoid 3,4-desaturase